MIFQPIRGSCFCLVCGRCYWIDDDGLDIEEGEAEDAFPPEDI
jgi:hypothetical protein